MTQELVPSALITDARAGRTDSLERLLEAVWPHAYRIAYSIVRNESAAEDAAQDACAIVYRQIGTLRSPDAFRVWLYRIVAREAIRCARQSHSAPAASPETEESDRDKTIDVRRGLEALSPNLRAVIVLHYYAELNSREIAAILNVAAATVRFRLMLARRHLKPLLQGYGRQKISASPERKRL